MDNEKIIEFDKIKEMWMNLAVTEGAKVKIRETSYCLDETKLRKMMQDTTNGKNLMEKLGMPPLQSTGEINEILTAAEKGGCLTPYQLERVERVLASVWRLKLYLEKGKKFQNSLAYYEENLDSLEYLREEILRQIRNEEVDDYASKELKKRGGLFLVTTHYPEVKEYAKKQGEILNARMTFDKETLRPTYQMVIGEAGESCALHIADRLGMPNEMLRTAVRAAYGEDALRAWNFQKEEKKPENITVGKISKRKEKKGGKELEENYHIGDSVMVYPDKKIGIVCQGVNEKGVLRVQLPGKKIWINHKRVKLHVAASKLYPEDYDFSIIFDTVENRKIRHDMDRKYMEEVIVTEESAWEKGKS